MTTFTVYIDPAVKNALKECAEKRGRPWTASSIAALAIQEFLDKEKKRKS